MPDPPATRPDAPARTDSTGSAGGTYAVIYRCDADLEIVVGKLGHVALTKGYYVYVGSAFGPGGLRARGVQIQSRHGRTADLGQPHDVLVVVDRRPPTCAS